MVVARREVGVEHRGTPWRSWCSSPSGVEVRVREQAVLHKQWSALNGETTLRFSSLQPCFVSGEMSSLNLEGIVRYRVTVVHFEHLPENAISMVSSPSEWTQACPYAV